MPPRLPVPAPERSPETAEFWDATLKGQLLLSRCEACGEVIWYPRGTCPACGGQSVSWIETSGLGTVYSFTVVHRNPGPFQVAVPYVVAYVQLAEGPRVLTNIVDCDPGEVHIGQHVRAVFFNTGEGSALYRFQPVVRP